MAETNISLGVGGGYRNTPGTSICGRCPGEVRGLRVEEMIPGDSHGR
jgi:hypothetical protein